VLASCYTKRALVYMNAVCVSSEMTRDSLGEKKYFLEIATELFYFTVRSYDCSLLLFLFVLIS